MIAATGAGGTPLAASFGGQPAGPGAEGSFARIMASAMEGGSPAALLAILLQDPAAQGTMDKAVLEKLLAGLKSGKMSESALQDLLSAMQSATQGEELLTSFMSGKQNGALQELLSAVQSAARGTKQGDEPLPGLQDAAQSTKQGEELLQELIAKMMVQSLKDFRVARNAGCESPLEVALGLTQGKLFDPKILGDLFDEPATKSENTLKSLGQSMLDGVSSVTQGGAKVEKVAFSLGLMRAAMQESSATKAGDDGIITITVPLVPESGKDSGSGASQVMKVQMPALDVKESEKFFMLNELKKEIKPSDVDPETLFPSTPTKGVDAAAAEKTPLPQAAQAPDEAKTFSALVLRQVLERTFKPPMRLPSEVTMKLNPAELGEILVRVSLEDRTLRVNMTTTDPGTKSILEGGLTELKSAIQALGLKSEAVMVSLNQDPNGRNPHAFNQKGPKRARLTTPDGAPDESEDAPAALTTVNYFA